MRVPLVPPHFYFVGQAVLIGLWWIWMFLSEPAREMFQAGGGVPGGLMGWAPPDLLLLLPASVWAGVAIARERPIGVILAWCVTGALGYAGAWCVSCTAQFGGGWLASQCMCAAAVGSGVSAWNAQRSAAERAA